MKKFWSKLLIIILKIEDTNTKYQSDKKCMEEKITDLENEKQYMSKKIENFENEKNNIWQKKSKKVQLLEISNGKLAKTVE